MCKLPLETLQQDISQAAWPQPFWCPGRGRRLFRLLQHSLLRSRRVCLMCDLTRNPELIRKTKPDFEQEPKGTIRGGFVGLKTSSDKHLHRQMRRGLSPMQR